MVTLKRAPALEGLTLERELGRGAHSVVYLAQSEQGPCAVKVPHGEALTERARARFIREGWTLAQLKHDHLIEVLALGESEGRPYLVMEYMAGKSLAARLVEGPFSHDEVVSLARALAGALGELHRRGIVHRDVTARNVLIDDEGRPKLADLGLAGRMAELEEGGGAIAATFAYAPPEQTGMLDRPVDARSDLYALGVLMFECATGRRPFSANDVGELIRLHAVEPPPKLIVERETASAALSAIIDKLLSKDPDDRYPSSSSLLYDLERLGTLEAMASSSKPLSLGLFLEGLEPTPLIGRDHEIEQLRSAWRRAKQGRASVMVVEAEPGAGKTRLWRELLHEVRQEQKPVLSGKCSLDRPFGALRECVDSYLQSLEMLGTRERHSMLSRLRASMGDMRGLLSAFSPRLADALEAPPATAMEGAQEPFYDALAHLLLTIGEVHGGVVLFLDDIQWMDAATRAVVTRLALQAKKTPILVATTARSNAEYQPAVNGLMEELQAAHVQRLSLKALSEEAVADLVRAELGGLSLEEQGLSQIVRRANGSPLAAREYLAAMLDAGILRPWWGQWLMDVTGLEQISLPGDVIELIIRRVEGLGGKTREVLTFAAVIGTRFDQELCGALVSDVAQTTEALAQGLASRVIERDDDGFSFVHDRVREALLAAHDEVAQRALHQRVVEALRQLDRGERDIYALAEHTIQGEGGKNPELVYEANLAAGFKAKADFAGDRAVELLERAREYADLAGIPPAAEVHETLGEMYGLRGRVEEAIAELDRALERADDPIQRGQLRYLKAKAQFGNISSLEESWRELHRAFSELGVKMEGPPPVLLVKGLLSVLRSWFMRRTGLWHGTAKGRARERYQVLTKLYEMSISVCYFLLRPVDLMTLLLRGLYPATRLGPSRELTMLTAITAGVLSFMKKRKLAEAWALRAATMAHQLGDPMLIAMVAWRTTFRYSFTGESEDKTVEKWKQLLQQHGRWMNLAEYWQAVSAMSYTLMMRGHLKEAERWFERSLAASKLSTHYGPKFNSRINMVPISMLGRHADIDRELDELFQLRAQVPDMAGRDMSMRIVGNVMGHLVEQGRFEEAVHAGDETFAKTRVKPAQASFHSGHTYALFAYACVERCIQAPQDEELLAKLDEALALFAAFKHRLPTIEAHRFAIAGARAHFGGENKKADELLGEAARLADATNNPWASVSVARFRAYVLRSMDEEDAANRLAWRARAEASRMGWARMERSLEEEFNMVSTSTGTSVTGTATTIGSGTSSPSSSSTTNIDALHVGRRFDALKELSLASARSVDPNEVSEIGVREAVRILGAERGALFLYVAELDETRFAVGATSDGEVLHVPFRYSSSAVSEVVKLGQPLVLSGTDEGEILGAQSAVVEGIRSVVVAPLTMRDELLGVIYLDSRLSKGVFREEDLGLLEALGTQIAIALETARSAKLQAERAALEKDLAVVGAVQKLLMPQKREERWNDVEAVAYYQPADQSGGDLFWWERHGDLVRIIVGDVTGHGAGSAMVATVGVSTYRALRHLSGFERLDPLLEALNRNVLETCQGEYHIAFAALEIDLATRNTRWRAGGVPPILKAERGRRVSPLSVASAPLGSPTFAPAGGEVELVSGTRLLLYSDGITELPMPDGRDFGLKRLAKLLDETNGRTASESRQSIAERIEPYQARATEKDDLTFLIVDGL